MTLSLPQGKASVLKIQAAKVGSYHVQECDEIIGTNNLC